MFVDSHAHLTHSDGCDAPSAVIERATSARVSDIVNVCTDSAALEKGLKLSHSHPSIYTAAATTPHDAPSGEDPFMSEVKACAVKGQLVAIGEIGLDYYNSRASKKAQEACLIKYLKLALEYNLPVVIHCREAFLDLLNITKHHFQGGRGVVHCFTGTREEAFKLLDRGWFISLSGIITFKNSKGLREVVKALPLDRLFIETDTPYLAPQSKRGKQNEPAYLPEVAQCVADIFQIPVEEVALQTTAHAREFFNMSGL